MRLWRMATFWGMDYGISLLIKAMKGLCYLILTCLSAFCSEGFSKNTTYRIFSPVTYDGSGYAGFPDRDMPEQGKKVASAVDILLGLLKNIWYWLPTIVLHAWIWIT